MTPPEGFAADARVFEDPWQAQAFALVVELHARGAFTWSEWAAALSAQLHGPDHGGGESYYAAWLAALETLSVGKGLVDSPALARRKADWAQAYAHTPHGEPVELRAAGDLKRGAYSER